MILRKSKLLATVMVKPLYHSFFLFKIIKGVKYDVYSYYYSYRK